MECVHVLWFCIRRLVSTAGSETLTDVSEKWHYILVYAAPTEGRQGSCNVAVVHMRSLNLRSVSAPLKTE